MAIMKLYDNPLSGNCYRVRLLLNQLGVSYDKVNIDIFRGEHKTEEFRGLNPNQKLPVLVDGDLVLWESVAILLYLAKKYHPNDYISDDPAMYGQIVQWVTFAKTTIDPNLAVARYYVRFLEKNQVNNDELVKLQNNGKNALSVIEEYLGKADFLVGHYSVADIACYPYIKLSPEANIDLNEYPRILSWLGRIENQPGYLPVYE